MNLPKQILDKYATIVIPKNKTMFDKNLWNPKTQSNGKWIVIAHWTREYPYSVYGYTRNLVLWIPPKDCLVLEFEGSRQENDSWIFQTEQNCIKYGFDYCICDHEGTSAYLWIFNVEGMNTHEQRKALANLLIPEGSKIDYTNLGQTLVPIIEHKHWKHGHLHKIIKGKNPLEHKNSLSNVLNFLKKDSISQPTVSIRMTTQTTSSFCDNNQFGEILKKDSLVRSLYSGSLMNYSTPSEARMALICCLVAHGLDDETIKLVMSHTQGLNWNEKPHVHDFELAKARNYVKRPRGLS